MTDLDSLLMTGTARSIGAAIAARTVKAVDVTTWYLQRITRLNDGPAGLNCVRSVSPLALAQAALADAELEQGRWRGPLHGVPFLVKDNVFTADGTAASAGSRALADFVPPYEATLVRRLREAGAILLGKTNLTEFADFVSDTMPAEFSGAGGVVRHPLGHRFGRGLGSSVGSAAAVAARLCAFAIGSETQNSIQAPALHTSIVGFKPSVGRVGCHGVVPLVPSQDSPGPLTITVDDAMLVYRAMAGADAGNEQAPAARPVGGWRIGVPRSHMADAADPASNRAFAQALASLANAGAEIVDPCDLPAAQQLSEVRSSVFRTEFKESLNVLLQAHRPGGIASLQDIIDWNQLHPEAIPYGQSLLEAANATAGTGASQYVADRQRDIALSLDQGICAALAAGSVDVLLVPMAVAARCTGKAGAPVVAVPVGQDETGLPFGVTVFAAPGSDELVLAAAAAIERVIGRRMLP